jgi:MFS family permease
MATPPANPELREASVGDLVGRLTEDMRALARQEVELGKAELAQKGKQAGVGAGLIGGGATFGFLALAAITAAVIGLLDTAMRFWVAALIVGVVLAIVAAVLALTGKNRVQEAAPPVPEQTVDSVKEDVKWLKTRS